MAHKEHALSVEQPWFHLLQSHSSLALPTKVKMGTSHEGDFSVDSKEYKISSQLHCAKREQKALKCDR